MPPRLRARLTLVWLVPIAVMSLACGDRQPRAPSASVQDQAEALIALLDTLHALIGRDANIIFRERAVTFDTLQHAFMATQNHSSATTDALGVLEHIDLDPCVEELCDIPDSGATGNRVQMVSCSIPQPADGGLEVHCRILKNMFGEIQAASAYVLVAPREGSWRVRRLAGYADR